MRDWMHVCRALGLALALCTATAAKAETVTVAVAANFLSAMRDIAASFEASSGHEVALVSGSSGKLVAQIAQGAPFQAFFSADQAGPAALEQRGLALPGSRFTYAIGALALWSPRAGVIDARGTILKQGRFERLAMANPRLAPYGRAAAEVLAALGLDQETRMRRVYGENVAQAYQFVDSGNADIGLVALAQIRRPGRVASGSMWPVPASLHTPIRQDAVVLNSARSSAAVAAFMDFARGDEARLIMRGYGYQSAAGAGRE